MRDLEKMTSQSDPQSEDDTDDTDDTDDLLA
jgi:hypothetical protein